MVALVRDGDHLVAEAEREQGLGRRGDEAGDAHASTMAGSPTGANRGQALSCAPWSCSPTARSNPASPSSRVGSGEGETIVKTFELADFVGSVEFVGKLVEPAEEMGHHPDLTVSWNKVGVSITTHSAGGLTANDFELAKRIDGIAGS